MKKRILVLGGTMFVGRILVEKLKELPHYELTLFNRGKSNANLYADVNQLHGDRETDDILQICNQEWDCIIDFSGYYPVTFERLLNDLRGKVKRYIFISTVSVYNLGKFEGRAVTEVDEIHGCTEEQKASRLPDAYGEKKAEMERILQAQDWLDKIILRPSFIYGRFDWTNRFYYWLYRAKFSDRILMPKDSSVAFTYAEDLAAGILNAVETDEHQTIYNTISQNGTSLREVVNIAANLLDREVEFVDADASVGAGEGLHGATFPLSVPMNINIEGTKWFDDFDISPVDFTRAIEESIEYYDSLRWPEPGIGLSVAKEKEILGES
jgi:2'-hydroxyisoflavone reductase